MSGRESPDGFPHAWEADFFLTIDDKNIGDPPFFLLTCLDFFILVFKSGILAGDCLVDRK